MSCYAFFKGWLLLSQPPSCLNNSTSFTTEQRLGTLADGPGCFPLATRTCSALLTCWYGLAYSEFGKSGYPSGPQPFSVSLPHKTNLQQLYLHIFRGEPAIAKFDWHFTPYHKSSQPFETDTGSVLQLYFYSLQPAHGKLTWLRV